MVARASAAFGVTAMLLAGSASAASTDAALNEALNALLQGDAATALKTFDQVDTAQLTAKRKDAIACIRGRFAGADPPDGLPPATSAILAAYRWYWRDYMLKRATPEEAQAKLLGVLNAMPALSAASDHASLDSVSDYVVTAVEKEGLHALTGKTEPLYELMIWKAQETRTYDVKLPENAVKVKVVFLEDFASPGWAGYATCGIAQTGGWAKPDALYAVKSSYDLDSESFRVSYLAHEGQHFSDYGKYPLLEQPELEYRAKLTEIALATTTTDDLLKNFASQGGDSRDVPHAYANRKVTLALKGVPTAKIHEAAVAKLRESSALLQRRGPATTKRFLD